MYLYAIIKYQICIKEVLFEKAIFFNVFKISKSDLNKPNYIFIDCRIRLQHNVNNRALADCQSNSVINSYCRYLRMCHLNYKNWCVQNKTKIRLNRYSNKEIKATNRQNHGCVVGNSVHWCILNIAGHSIKCLL